MLATETIINARVAEYNSAELTGNSSGDEIANVNFLYDDIVHVGLRTTKYNTLVHKFRHRWTRLCVRTQVYQIR